MKKRKPQNSGVVVKAFTSSFASTKDNNPILSDLMYYGILKNIIELDYTADRRVVLFECVWVSKGKRLNEDNDGFILTNFTNVKHHNEPFVLASQVQQVFYVEDPVDPNWHVVITTSPRIQIICNYIEIDIEDYLQSETFATRSYIDEDVQWTREEVDGMLVE